MTNNIGSLKRPKFSFSSIRALPKTGYKKTTYLIKKRPLISFVVVLLLLIGLIALGNAFKPPVRETPNPEIIKDVSVLTLGKSAVTKISGQVEKQGILQIMAQGGGVVSKISVSEGEKVKRGNNLISLSSNYQGGNAASISRQIAQKQFESAKQSEQFQKEIIAKQKDIAEQTATNTEELRKIAESTNNDTKSLLSMNQEILNTINDQLEDLIDNNPGGVNDQLILQTRQSRAQLQQAVNTLQSTVRSADYANNTNNPPTRLANLNKEITLKQLELQEKTLTLTKEVAQLQVSLAAVNEAMMFPASPCKGTVQKIHVVKGELVSPGSPLVTIACEHRSTKVIAKVPSQTAKQASMLSESLLYIDGERVFLLPEFISSEPTDGQLFQIIYQLPEAIEEQSINGSFINIDLPIGGQKSAAVFFVPLDSVFQTQESAFVYIVEGDVASSRKVVLGEVLGSDIEVMTGLNQADQVILDRNVIAGDKVRVKSP